MASFIASIAGRASVLRWLCIIVQVLMLDSNPVTQADAASPERTPAQWLELLYTSTQFQENWFAPDFLAKLPFKEITQVIAQQREKLGAFEGVVQTEKGFQVNFDRAAIPLEIGFDADNRIATLRFQAAIPQVTSADPLRAGFQALPGKVSLLVRSGRDDVIALNPDQPLAVGSAFKLAILAATADAVRAGKLTWGDKLALRDDWRALPNGILQDWPEGSVLTAETLAGLMISLSDNTAADALMSVVGRQAVEAYSPRNRPFLTPREMFILRAVNNRELREQYLAADEAGKRALLDTVDKQPLPEVAENAQSVTLGIEWVFTPRELCDLIEKTHDLPAMKINPGLALPAEWRSIAFKGGNDVGVLSLTTWVEAKSGRKLCIAASWNDETAVDERRFIPLYQELLRFLLRTS
jgi:hypothetical protein